MGSAQKRRGKVIAIPIAHRGETRELPITRKRVTRSLPDAHRRAWGARSNRGADAS